MSLQYLLDTNIASRYLRRSSAGLEARVNQGLLQQTVAITVLTRAELRSGQAGPSLGTVTLAPGGQRQLRLRLIYPADATPPQVLSLLPLAPPTSPTASP